MKKNLIITILALFPLVCIGRDNGALKFLGIPIDGTELQFVTKLKSKGFKYNSLFNNYNGQFNGQNVDVYVHTNHNLVDRVYVAFPYYNEDNIKVEYNLLLNQFNNNGKYLDFSMNDEIPENEDISYEMTVNEKRYQASYCYFDPDRDPVEFMDALVNKFSDFYTDDQLAALKDYCHSAMNATAEEQERLQSQMIQEMQTFALGEDEDVIANDENAALFILTLIDGMKSLADGDVWFMIHEYHGKYQIGLYYDNLHNRAHGEDL